MLNSLNKAQNCLLRVGCTTASTLGVLVSVLMMLFSLDQTAYAQKSVVCSTSLSICNLQGYQMQDLRALGMGNAYGPVARGEGALRYNPAGLAQQPKDLKAEINLGIRGTQFDFLTDTQKTLKSDNPTVLSDFLETYNDTQQSYGVEVIGDIVWNRGKSGFGLGILSLKSLQFEFNFLDTGNDGFTPLTDRLVFSRAKLELPIVGVGVGLFERALLVGIAYKNIAFETKTYSATYTQYVVAKDLSLDSVATTTRYEGNALDFGVLWRVNQRLLRPVISVSGQNINTPTLTQTQGIPEKLTVLPAYNVGISLSPVIGVFHFLLSAEMHDISGEVKRPRSPTDRSLVKRSVKQRMHYGAELGIVELATGDFLLALRAGANQGNATMGAELNLFHILRVSYTKWSEDVGHAETKDLREYEAVFVSLGAGF